MLWIFRAACRSGGCRAVVLIRLPPASGSPRVTGGLTGRSDKWGLRVCGGVAHEAGEDLRWEAVPCLPAAVSLQASRSRIFVGGESLRSRRGAGSGPAGADGNVGPPSAGEAAPAARHAPGPAAPPPPAPGTGMPVPLRSWRGAAERSLPGAWLQRVFAASAAGAGGLVRAGCLPRKAGGVSPQLCPCLLHQDYQSLLHPPLRSSDEHWNGPTVLTQPGQCLIPLKIRVKNAFRSAGAGFCLCCHVSGRTSLSCFFPSFYAVLCLLS